VAPPIADVIAPDSDLVDLLARRRAMFSRLYRDLKPSFLEFAS
jgi:hypothetical protein